MSKTLLFGALVLRQLISSVFAGDSKREVKAYPGGQYIAYQDGVPIDYWRMIDGFSVRVKPLELDGQSLDVIVITQREGELRQKMPLDPMATDPTLNYVPAIFSYVRAYVHKIYGDRFGEQIVDLVKNERDFLNGVSDMVIVCERNNLKNIKGVFRSVHRGNEPQNLMHDMELTLKFDLPSIEAKTAVVDGKEVLIGDWIENKTLVKSDDAPPSLYDFLWVLMDDYGFYERSDRVVEINGKKFNLLPDRVAHEAAPAQRRLYRKTLGFQDLPEMEGAQWHQVVDLKAQLDKVRAKLGDKYTRFRDSPPVFGWNRLPLYDKGLYDELEKAERPPPIKTIEVVKPGGPGFVETGVRRQFSDWTSSGPDFHNVRTTSSHWKLEISPNRIPFYQQRDDDWLFYWEKYQGHLAAIEPNTFNLLSVMPWLRKKLPRFTLMPPTNPFHAGDIFIRLGIPYDLPDGILSMGEFQQTIHNIEHQRYQDGRLNSTTLGLNCPVFGEPPWSGPELNSQSLGCMAAERDRLMIKYQGEAKLRLLDSRLEDDLELTDKQRILRILRFPSQFFSDLAWATKQALELYRNDPELEPLFVEWISMPMLLDHESHILGLNPFDRLIRRDSPSLKDMLGDGRYQIVAAIREIREAKLNIQKALENSPPTYPAAIEEIAHKTYEQYEPPFPYFIGIPSHLVLASALAIKHPEFIPFAFGGMLLGTIRREEHRQIVENMKLAYAEWSKTQSSASIEGFLKTNGVDLDDLIARGIPKPSKYSDDPRRQRWRNYMSAFARIPRDVPSDTPKATTYIRSAVSGVFKHSWPEFAALFESEGCAGPLRLLPNTPAP